MKVVACIEDEEGRVQNDVPDDLADYFALYTADADGVWEFTQGYPSRDEARTALAEAANPDRTQPEPEPPVNVPLGDAIDGYRMNRTAARIALDAYSEAINTPGVSATEAEQRKRLAEREHSVDMAAVCTLSSLRALDPYLTSDERVWADRLQEHVDDPATLPGAKAERLSSVLGVINVGRLEGERLRRRALDPDDQVFGADRAEAARYARNELAQAQAAYDAAGGGWAASDAVTERLNRAKRARANYREYVD